MGSLKEVSRDASGRGSLYRLDDSAYAGVDRFVASTPQSRAICNDPFVVGVGYTATLMEGCATVLRLLSQAGVLALEEHETTVLHILRGGLNFGLREALSHAYGFNAHSSAFVSAQRARKHDNPHDWIITESSYQKVSFHGKTHLILGDVVATGTSLEYALRKIAELAAQQHGEITGITFFTIGGPRSHELIDNLTGLYRERFPSFRAAQVVYLEGIFSVAVDATPVTIKIDGTDLLRRDAVLAPEFLASQYESASYPIERCTIYDAGSRAFDLDEYFHDVRDYWEKNLALAESGIRFERLLAERLPEIDAKRFGTVDLKSLCVQQLDRIPRQFRS